MMNRKIYGESNVWSTAQGYMKIYRFDADVSAPRASFCTTFLNNCGRG